MKADRRLRKRDFLWFGAAIALPIPWVLAEAWGGLGISSEWIAVLGGLAILGAAFMLSWSCELAERDIPQSLALLALALVGVLPEYAIDLHFAWTAGKDPTYASYAVANMTGANRLLIGIGWAAVAFVACRRSGEKELEIHPRQRLELRFLVWATLYSFVIPLSGTINLLDAVILLTLFAAYVNEARKGETDDPELEGPAALVESEFEDTGRRIWAVSLFIFAGFAIWVSAAPFADALVHVGREHDIDEFLLVQWIAPLASEAPEFIVAILFAMRLRGSLGIGTLVSSKVNQWTLLVGAIPIAYAISLGGFSGLPLDDRQTAELVLTSAQSLLAAILLSDLKFRLREAMLLATLFIVQLFFPGTFARWVFVWIYLGAALIALSICPAQQRHAFFEMVFTPPFRRRAR